jgi:hypothetical protein
MCVRGIKWGLFGGHWALGSEGSERTWARSCAGEMGRG